MFYAGVVGADKPLPYVPPPDNWSLHLSHCALPLTVTLGTRVSLVAKLPDESRVTLCTLRAGKTDNVPLDLFLSEYTEFLLEARASNGDTLTKEQASMVQVHLTGYFSPQMMDPEEEDEDEDEEEGDPMMHLSHEMDSDELEEYMHSNGFHGGAGEDEDESEDEDEDDSSEDDDEVPRRRRQPSVVIEDITEGEDAAKKARQGAAPKAAKALPAPQVKQQQGKQHKEPQQKPQLHVAQPTQQAADGGVDEYTSDEQEDDGSKGANQDEDEAGEEEQEEAAKEVQPAKAGSKRKAPNAAAPAPVKKAAATPVKQQPTHEPGKAPAPAHKQQQKQQEQKPQAKAAAAAAKDQKQQPQTPKSQSTTPRQEAGAAKGEQTTPGAPASKLPPGSAGKTPARKLNVRRYDNGFEVHDLHMGAPNGKLAKAGKKVAMRYIGRLQNGKVFDQTKGKATFKFRLGVGEVIKGWDRGVEGMRVGDKRRLVIPPQMGYGSARTGPIPPNSTLDFEVELVDVN